MLDIIHLIRTKLINKLNFFVKALINIVEFYFLELDGMKTDYKHVVFG